MDQRRAN